MKRKNIRIQDIQTGYPYTERHVETDALVASIKNMGLNEPLLVNPANLSLISGRRRLRACLKAGLRSVRVAMPDDVQEACEELGTHVTSPDFRYAMAMSPREKLDLALRLNSLPRSPEMIAENSYYDKFTAPAVGFSSRSLWRLRAALLRAEREKTNPPISGSTESQNLLALMLSALECPVEGYSSNRIIDLLHESHKRGESPVSLEEVAPPKRRGRPLKEEVQLPSQPESSEKLREASQKFPQGEFRRGIDLISGAVSGLESLMYVKPPTGEEAESARTALRKTQKAIRQMLKSI